MIKFKSVAPFTQEMQLKEVYNKNISAKSLHYKEI